MSDSNFVDIETHSSGAAFSIYESILTIKSSTFQNLYHGVLLGERLTKLTIQDSTFTSNWESEVGFGGVAFCRD